MGIWWGLVAHLCSCLGLIELTTRKDKLEYRKEEGRTDNVQAAGNKLFRLSLKFWDPFAQLAEKE